MTLNQRFHWWLKRSAIVFVLCLAAASASLSDAKIKDRPLSPAETALDYEARTLNDQLFRLYVQKVEGQETQGVIHDPVGLQPVELWDLERLTLAAFYFHPDLDVARARWKTTTQGIANAGARPNPLFQSQPRYSFNSPGNASPWYLQLFSGFTIETAGKRGHRLEQATHWAEATRMNIGQIAWQVRSRLRTSLLNHLAASERLKVLQAQQQSQQALLEGFAQRVAVGEASELDNSQTRIALDQIQLQIQENNRQAWEGFAQTAQAIGITVDTLKEFPLATDWFEAPPSLASISRMDLRREALLGRADILSLMKEYQASHAALKLVISQKYPDVRIGPGYLWNQGQHFFALPLDLVFATQYSSSGAIKEALARRNEVSARFMAVQAQVIGEVDRGYTTYQAALDKIHAAQALVHQHKRRVQMIERQVAVGEADRLSLKLAETELQTARLSQVDTLLQAQQALGLLEDAIQRPLASVRPSVQDLQAVPRSGQNAP